MSAAPKLDSKGRPIRGNREWRELAEAAISVKNRAVAALKWHHNMAKGVLTDNQMDFPRHGQANPDWSKPTIRERMCALDALIAELEQVRND